MSCASEAYCHMSPEERALEEDRLRAVARATRAEAERDALRAELREVEAAVVEVIHDLANASVPGITLAKDEREKGLFRKCAESCRELQELARRMERQRTKASK